MRFIDAFNSVWHESDQGTARGIVVFKLVSRRLRGDKINPITLPTITAWEYRLAEMISKEMQNGLKWDE